MNNVNIINNYIIFPFIDDSECDEYVYDSSANAVVENIN